MKNKIILLMLLLLSLIVTGCTNVNSHISFIMNVDTGDSVEVRLDTTDGYTIKAKKPFEIWYDNELISTGTFVTSEYYKTYKSVLESEYVNEDDESTTLIESGTVEENKYLFWNYNDEEYNYIILIGDSSTGLVLINMVSENSAREAFNRLTLKLQ